MITPLFIYIITSLLINTNSFFQAAAVSILLYRCTTWTLTKHMEKKLDSNYTRMLRAILNKSWRQRPTKQQLYGQLPPITKTIKIRRTRHARHCWRSRDELINDVLLWTPSHDDQLEPTYSSSVSIRDVALKTCWKQWAIGRGSERGSGISVLTAQHDDVDDIPLNLRDYPTLYLYNYIPLNLHKYYITFTGLNMYYLHHV